MKKVFLQFLFIFGGIFIVSACGYESYDDCLLGEMKGQDQSVLNNAQKVCERKHPYEKPVFYSDGNFEITWSKNLFEQIAEASKGISNTKKIVFTVNASNTEYRITKAFIELTKTECEDLKKPKGSFSGQKYDIDFYVTFNKDNIGYYEADDAWEYECMRTGTIHGIIDK
jgi:hypothetical protein